MKKALIVALAVLVFAPSAEAARTDKCRTHGDFDPIVFACYQTVTATEKPKSFQALGQRWHEYASRWITSEDHYFLALGGHRPWCRLFGRYKTLRVIEDSCDGNLIVTLRSIGPPRPVTFSWEVLR